MSETTIVWVRRRAIRLILITVGFVFAGVVLFLFLDLLPTLFAAFEPPLPVLPESFVTGIVLLLRVVIVGGIILGIVWEGFRMWEEWEKRKAKADSEEESTMRTNDAPTGGST